MCRDNVHVKVDAAKGQKGWILLEWELQVIASHLIWLFAGIKLISCGRVVHVLTH